MKHKLFATLAAVAVASAASLQAQFTITNPSFENPNNPGSTPVAPDNWTQFASGLASGGVIADSNTGIPTAPDGTQWLTMESNNNSGSAGRGGYFSDVIGTVQLNTDYEFTFTLGENSSATSTATSMDLFLQTLSGGSPDTTIFSSTFNPDTLIGAGSTVVHSVTINSGSGVTAGHDFRVGFRLDEANSNGAVVLVDDVSIVPEPGAYALLAGCAGLLFVMLRRRRA